MNFDQYQQDNRANAVIKLLQIAHEQGPAKVENIPDDQECIMNRVGTKENPRKRYQRKCGHDL
jgi:hypothetical protein